MLLYRIHGDAKIVHHFLQRYSVCHGIGVKENLERWRAHMVFLFVVMMNPTAVYAQ